jgi:hypothetical protein
MPFKAGGQRSNSWFGWRLDVLPRVLVEACSRRYHSGSEMYLRLEEEWLVSNLDGPVSDSRSVLLFMPQVGEISETKKGRFQIELTRYL